MFSLRKYLWCLLVLCVLASAAAIYMDGWGHTVVLVFVIGAAAALILRGVLGAARHSQKQYEVLLSRLGNFHLADNAKFDRHEAMVCQLDAAVRQTQRSVDVLAARPEQVARRVGCDEIKARAASELKFRVLDDIAAVRQLLEESNLRFPVESDRSLGLANND